MPNDSREQSDSGSGSGSGNSASQHKIDTAKVTEYADCPRQFSYHNTTKYVVTWWEASTRHNVPNLRYDDAVKLGNKLHIKSAQMEHASLAPIRLMTQEQYEREKGQQIKHDWHD